MIQTLGILIFNIYLIKCVESYGIKKTNEEVKDCIITLILSSEM